MKKNWKLKIAKLVMTTLLLTCAVPYVAIGEESPMITAKAARYDLTGSVKVEVKSVLNERTANGTRVGIVIRLFNTADRLNRVPDYELRVKTTTGTEYTLRPSAANSGSIQPQEKVELSYMIILDRSDEFALASVSWFEIDEFEYPKKERLALTIPIQSMEWKGDQTVIADESTVPWGDTFSIPLLSSSLEYKPVNLSYQNGAQGPVAVVTLLARNTGQLKETVPELRIDGKVDKKVYHGSRVSPKTAVLSPGEQQYVYFAVPLESNVELGQMVVLSPESFVAQDKTSTDYTVGRLNIRLMGTGSASQLFTQLIENDVNKPIEFDLMNKLIPQGVDVSLMELHMHGAEGDGYKTAIAKFKLQNHKDRPVAVPNFQAELRSTDGFSYMGNRQSAAAQSLIPNLGYVISYSFNVPNSETGDKLIMNLLDGETAAPYQVPIAAFRTQTRTAAAEGDMLTLYPFQVKIADWTLTPLFSAGNYSYKIKMKLDLNRIDNIVVDQNFSKMKIELADSQGRTIGSETLSFTGVNRLINGEQTFTFTNIRTEQQEYPLTVRIFESIDTPFGEAKRLVTTLQQR